MIAAIDAHHHLWNYSAEEYGWISDDMAVLRRDFTPAGLKERMDAAGVAGAVAVQARQSVVETEWLLQLASKNDFMMGVVGWLPLASPGVGRYLERWGGNGKWKGVRHVVQDEPDDRFLLGEAFQAGVGELEGSGLVYDILIYERHLPVAVEFVDHHPRQRFVLDHVAKPRIRDGAISPWRENLRELARRENVYCKVSGMATEADWKDWTGEGLRPYFEVALEAFGPARLMFGSDWPVLEVAGTYGKWVETVREWVLGLSEDEQRRILRETAVEAYGLRVRD
ncbi:MAG: amidohydrolase family protein [Bryobacterales bacterium]|nr:amidohydrolase family protein [Bryobacterales bacterium]